GKGYPDVATRSLLRRLAEMPISGAPVNATRAGGRRRSTLPVYALVDGDPHGIHIYMCYKFGSQALAHDTARLATPSLCWVGLRPSDPTVSRDRMLELTPRDRSLALSVLHDQKLAAATRHDDTHGRLHSRLDVREIRREMSFILHHNTKAEIEAIAVARLVELLGPLWLGDEVAGLSFPVA
ncbi:Meiotic recombination protein W68, partial [Cladochytrium tenue]